MKTQIAIIARRGGAIASGDWTTGTGNYVSKRAIPQGCVEMEKEKLASFDGPARSKKAAERLLKKRPLVKKLILVTDWKLAKKAVDHVEAEMSELSRKNEERIAAKMAAKRAKALGGESGGELSQRQIRNQ